MYGSRGRRHESTGRSASLPVLPVFCHLGGPPGSPKLVLAPANGGGAPPDACEADSAAAPSAASPSELAGGRRMAGRRQMWTERGLSTREMH